ncbi:FAD/NAD(P)-binding protein [bacterium]|nr:FAD/NAD(P)-binding protein [bacterium]
MGIKLRHFEPSKVSYLSLPARIESVQKLTRAETLYRIQLCDGRPLGHQPGQFVQVSLFGVGEAPISITSSPTQTPGFELCVRRVGSVTGALARLSEGATLGIRGPFGSGFPVQQLTGRNLVLVAGGLGLAPLRSLINYVLDKRPDFGEVHVVYGTRSPDDILFQRDIISWSTSDIVRFHLTVDIAPVGWRGNVGVVTTLFPRLTVDPDNTSAVIVGPPVMYKFVVRELLEMGVSADQMFLSLERRMKCGLGKCGHCQINQVYVCQEGPCFCYADLADLPEAI